MTEAISRKHRLKMIRGQTIKIHIVGRTCKLPDPIHPYLTVCDCRVRNL
jgi:hypothetical protein